MKIGVVVTTKDRPAVAIESIKWHKKNTQPFVDEFIVIDDNSTMENSNKVVDYYKTDFDRLALRNIYFYMEEWLGVSGARNMGLHILSDLGCDHVFVMDDDIFPLVENWVSAYINAHDMNPGQCWIGASPSPIHSTIQQMGRANLANKTRFLGGFYSMNADALQKLGGFEAFGKYGYEDADYSQRAHRAGLSPIGLCPGLFHDSELFHFCDVQGDLGEFKWGHRSAIHDEKAAILEETKVAYLNRLNNNPTFKPFR
jgi:GT2 family glycosyltransferase